MSYKKVWIPIDHLLALAFRHPVVQDHLRADKLAKAYLDVDEETGRVTGVIVEEYDQTEVQAALDEWFLGEANYPAQPEDRRPTPPGPWWMWQGQPRPESRALLQAPLRKRGLIGLARRLLGLDASVREARMTNAKMRRSHTLDREAALALLACPPVEVADTGADGLTLVRQINATDLRKRLSEPFPLVLDRTARLRLGYRHPQHLGPRYEIEAFVLSYENRAALRD